MSHRNARLTHAGAYSSSSGFEIRACLLPMSPKRWESHANAPIAGCGASTRRVWPDSRTVRADLIVRLGAPTPAVSAESWPPAESTAAAQPNWPS